MDQVEFDGNAARALRNLRVRFGTRQKSLRRIVKVATDVTDSFIHQLEDDNKQYRLRNAREMEAEDAERRRLEAQREQERLAAAATLDIESFAMEEADAKVGSDLFRVNIPVYPKLVTSFDPPVINSRDGGGLILSSQTCWVETPSRPMRTHTVSNAEASRLVQAVTLEHLGEAGLSDFVDDSESSDSVSSEGAESMVSNLFSDDDIDDDVILADQDLELSTPGLM